MTNKGKKLLLVGDNPFHGISHLSQERARARGVAIDHAEYAAKLVEMSLENGANGFMFSVSDKTLSILQVIREKRGDMSFELYAIVPYAYEMVRVVTKLGTTGLAKKIGKQVALSGNLRAIATGLNGIVRMDPVSIMKTYVMYEISRIRATTGKGQNLVSVMLHEVLTDMFLALDLEWLFKEYVRFMEGMGIKPGFETRNFAFLVKKFIEWNIDFGNIVIASPFNKMGFQMNPSREECEKALAEITGSTVIAMSVLAAGYLKLPDVVEYVEGLNNISGVVVGVSKEKHANETFRVLKKKLL
jgi:hypothetical protein